MTAAKVTVSKTMPPSSMFAGARVEDLPTGYLCHMIETGRMLQQWPSIYTVLQHRLALYQTQQDPVPSLSLVKQQDWYAGMTPVTVSKYESMLRNERKEWDPKYQPRTKDNLITRVQTSIALLAQQYPHLTVNNTQQLYQNFFVQDTDDVDEQQEFQEELESLLNVRCQFPEKSKFELGVVGSDWLEFAVACANTDRIFKELSPRWQDLTGPERCYVETAINYWSSQLADIWESKYGRQNKK